MGVWGEWYYTDSFGFPSDSLSTRNVQDRRSLLLKLVDVANGIPLLVRTPAIKRSATQQTTAVTEAEAVAGTSSASKIGHHNDCFLASTDDFGTYDNVATDKQFVSSDATVCQLFLLAILEIYKRSFAICSTPQLVARLAPSIRLVPIARRR